MSDKDHARKWLRQYGYADVADMIDEIMGKWQKEGKRTRRNWWDILAGGKDGKPRTVEGKHFPVLRTAQIRQGKTVTANAIARGDDEPAQSIWTSARWPDREKKGTTSHGKRRGPQKTS